jgi:DNA mismatch repair ATPase MutS
MNEFKKYEEMVENTIDIDGAQNYSYSIKSDFDPDLQEAKERSDNIEEEIQ